MGIWQFRNRTVFEIGSFEIGRFSKLDGQKKMKLKRAKLEQNEPALVMIRLGNLAEHLGFLTRSKRKFQSKSAKIYTTI